MLSYSNGMFEATRDVSCRVCLDHVTICLGRVPSLRGGSRSEVTQSFALQVHYNRSLPGMWYTCDIKPANRFGMVLVWRPCGTGADEGQ